MNKFGRYFITEPAISCLLSVLFLFSVFCPKPVDGDCCPCLRMVLLEVSNIAGSLYYNMKLLDNNSCCKLVLFFYVIKHNTTFGLFIICLMSTVSISQGFYLQKKRDRTLWTFPVKVYRGALWLVLNIKTACFYPCRKININIVSEHISEPRSEDAAWKWRGNLNDGGKN